MRGGLFGAALILLGCGFVFTACASAQGVVVRKLSPTTWRPGTTNRVEARGDGVGKVSAIWTSFGVGCVLLPDGGPDRLALEARLPEETPPGIHWIQFVGPAGLSEFTPIMVDRMETVELSAKALSSTEGPLVKPPVAFESASVEDGVQRVRFEAEAGRGISFQTVANPLGSQLDSVLRVLDPAGLEVAFCDEFPGVRNDACLRFTPAVSGIHTLVVHDVAHDGGARHFYRLRMGDFAIPGAPTPLAIHAGSQATVRFEAAQPPFGAVDLPSHGAGRGTRWFSLPDGLGFASVGLSALAALSDAPRGADAMPIPVEPRFAIDGSFGTEGEVDRYAVELKKGRRAEWVGASRSLGSACDLVLRLRAPNGEVVAESSPTSGDEGVVGYSAPEDGIYQLEVSELVGAAGPGLVYRVEPSSAPSFDLRVETNLLEVRPGEAGKLKLLCKRSGHDGPIRLHVEGGEGLVALDPAVVPEKKEEVEIQLAVSLLAKPGSLIQVRVRGEAVVAGVAHIEEVSTRPALRKAFPLVLHPARELAGLISIGVKE